MTGSLVPTALPDGTILVSPSGAFDNASVWHNLTSWTVQHLPFLNMTKLTPSLDDIVWAGPRMVKKLGRLGSFVALPDGVDGFGGFGGRVIPEATDRAGSMLYNHGITAMPPSGSFVAGAASAASLAGAAGAAGADADFSSTLAASASRVSLESARGLGSLFSYATSKWALCCIATAVILNRTYIFAATRRRVRLRWPVRLALRLFPIVLFVVQARKLLQSIQCQTSPDFSELRWGNSSKHSGLMFAEVSPVLHGLGSRLLFNPTDAASCQSVRMVPSDRYALAADLRGSLSLLWPLFLTFCLSHFVETLSCAVQGRPVAAETGMTVFEHSLAFAEADAAITNELGWGTFSAAASSASSTSSSASAVSSTLAAVAAAATAAGTGNASAGIAISRSMIMSRVNTPPEVLLLAFLSAMSHITSHVLGILNLQSKFRLLSTGFWALCFMGSIVWSALNFSLDEPAGQSLLRFPTVSIVGFIPHMLVLAGILVCCFIYGAALLLSALSQEPDIFATDLEQPTFRERLARAHANMQANLPMGNVRISMEMDFYTALLRAGFDAITMASEAVYLNEDRRVNLRPHTWLEDERYNELQEMRLRYLGSDMPGSRFDAVGATGLVPVPGSRMSSGSSGYARERTAQSTPTGVRRADRVRPARNGIGIGATERSGRWLMAVDYLIHVAKLVLTFAAIYVFRALSFIGISQQPRWLRRIIQRRKSNGEDGSDRDGADNENNEPGSEWLITSSGSFPILRREQIDVEQELRRRFVTFAGRDLSSSTAHEEREIDGKLYQWWLKGGWWGETDTSGDYEPSIAADDDVTSVISDTDVPGVGDEWEWEDDTVDVEDGDTLATGQRTPTQENPNPFAFVSPQESTPITDLPLAIPDLASLLDPRSPEERDQAQALAAHLKSDGILTRSAFSRFRQRQRAELLASSRFHGGGARRLASFQPGARLSPEEEAQLLEQILLSRRAATRPDDEDDLLDGDYDQNNGTASWATGAAGLGPDGPQCVVCQSAPRTIIVWPCRCLSLCDDCRVSLAMNNFDKCVCCRREVVSFSRIFVP